MKTKGGRRGWFAGQKRKDGDQHRGHGGGEHRGRGGVKLDPELFGGCAVENSQLMLA